MFQLIAVGTLAELKDRLVELETLKEEKDKTLEITVVDTTTAMQLDDFGNVINAEQQQESGVIDFLAPVPTGDIAAHGDSNLENSTEVGTIVAHTATESKR